MAKKYYITMVDKNYNKNSFIDRVDEIDNVIYAVEMEAPSLTQAIFKAYNKYPDMKVWE